MIPTLRPASGEKPRQLVVILHGWGADGANLIDLADLYRKALPHAQFIAPNAPDVCEVNPFGFQWFSLNNRSYDAMHKGVTTATAKLNAFLDEQLQLLGLTNKDLALVGFSQGTMLALHAALRRTPGIAGVLGYSGALLGAEHLSSEIKEKPPICLIHGDVDDVVPFASLALAQQGLKPHGIPLTTHRRPFLGHSIDMEGIQIGAEFLKKIF